MNAENGLGGGAERWYWLVTRQLSVPLRLAVRAITELGKAAMTATIRLHYIQTRLGIVARPQLLDY